MQTNITIGPISQLVKSTWSNQVMARLGSWMIKSKDSWSDQGAGILPDNHGSGCFH